MSAVVLWLARRRGIALVSTLALVLIGLFSLSRLPVDAVPDVTNNQVQVVTSSPATPAAEVEKQITLPVERAMAGLPGLKTVRSVSRLGISLVTLIFEEEIDLYFARAQVSERLPAASAEISPSLGRPQLGPVATGLGEILLFEVKSETHTPEELRTLLDWTISPRLRQVPGVIETVSFGGSVKQYRVTLDPARLAAQKVSIEEVREALEKSNQNAGGGAIERGGEVIVLRAEARFQSLDEIRSTLVRTLEGGAPLTVGMLGDVDTGATLRHGAMTADGEGEIVGGSVLMLKGKNSHEVVVAVKERIAAIHASLPPGVTVVPFLDRADFIDRTVLTVAKNLIEGAAVVIVVLFLTLGSLRAGLLAAGAIPFALLVAFAGLRALGMSANVMSLGAVDFGIIVEGTVVVAEHALQAAARAREKSVEERRRSILEACAHTARPVLFAVVIVVLVFLPLASLEDVEGKMFRSVVASLVIMLLASLFYALVLVPAVAPRLLAKVSIEGDPWLIRTLRRGYEPILAWAVRRPLRTMAIAAAIAVVTIAPAAKLGAEFLPRIFEGDIAIDARRPVSASLGTAIALSGETERALRQVPEVARVITRIGRSEGSIDPAGPESSDVFVILEKRDRWRPGLTPEKLVVELELAAARAAPGTVHAFSQPIEMRVNDLIAGVRSEVAIKVYGDDLDALSAAAEKIRHAVAATPGAADVKRETPLGLPTLRVIVDRERATRLGVLPSSVLSAVAMARAGESVGSVYEGERSFDLVLRLGGEATQVSADLGRFPVLTQSGELLPLSSVATLVEERGVSQISREKLRRRLVVECNVRGRDLVGFVADARQRVEALSLPPSVEVEWGGQFENFERAKNRLTLLLPIALGLIGVMLWSAYRSVALTLVTLLTLPFALGGGVVALVVRGLPFSIPAAVGFIALAGVSVMGGSVMTARLLEVNRERAIDDRVKQAATSTFRPMISTALVAALGFVPMAIATGAGAEVQRPLATVVIGGLVVSTAAALFLMPAMMSLVLRWFGAPTSTATSTATDEVPEVTSPSEAPSS